MIQIVLFDLGSTLIYAKTAWANYFRQGDEALVQVLQRAGISLSGETFCDEFGTFIDQYYARFTPQDTIERTALSALEEILAEKGYTNVPAPVLHAGLNALYSVTNQNWCAEEDAIPSLEMLKHRGYRLGMISNTSDDAHVQILIDENGFRPYFEFVVTSAGFGIRKPDRRIFQVALDHFHAKPETAAMVGDTLEADILGANDVGIYSIWITRRAAGSDPTIIPQATVSTLQEIPDLLKTIR